jgi:hypothetical protein
MYEQQSEGKMVAAITAIVKDAHGKGVLDRET